MNHQLTIDWPGIDTVLLDMDGTLLDLHFDNYFWREHLPRAYAQRHGITLEKSRSRLYPYFEAQEGTMNWYCVDYWSRELDMDIALLKEEVAHLIAVHPRVIDFLKFLRKTGKHRVLVTNAHHKSLALKLKHTPLGAHLDKIVCAHDLGLPKENTAFWKRLHRVMSFDPATTLLIDDNLQVLDSAARHGIAHLVAVARPDSRQPVRPTGNFSAVANLGQLIGPSA